MNVKEALIAYLPVNSIEWRTIGRDGEFVWFPINHHDESIRREVLDQLFFEKGNPDIEFRLAPRTIIVNGVEVPAPEKDAPKDGDTYCIPDFGERLQYYDHTWNGDELDLRYLERGVVYLNKEDAIARAKAMLLTQSN